MIISVCSSPACSCISLGVIGEYLGRMYEEVKGRPLFLVAEELGIDSEKQNQNSPGPDVSGAGEPRTQ